MRVSGSAPDSIDNGYHLYHHESVTEDAEENYSTRVVCRPPDKLPVPTVSPPTTHWPVAIRHRRAVTV